jgi:hypothetical protein
MAFVNLGQVVYPIGAIYMSTNSTSPANIFGGSWSQISGNACLMAGSSVGNVGSKKITINNMPSHNHILGKNAQTFWYGKDWGGGPSNLSCSSSPQYKWEPETNYVGGGKIIPLIHILAMFGEELHKFGCDA